MKPLKAKPSPGLNVARVIIWTAFAAAIGWDIVVVINHKKKWPTISAMLRAIDEQMGTLLRYVLLGVWCHLFVGPIGKFKGRDV